MQLLYSVPTYADVKLAAGRGETLFQVDNDPF